MSWLIRSQGIRYCLFVLLLVLSSCIYCQSPSKQIAPFNWSFIPADISVETDLGKDYGIVTYSNPTVDIPNGILISQLNGFSSGTKLPIGNYLYEFCASDTLGNEIICSFSVRVEDNESPVISECPPDLFVIPDLGECDKTVNYNFPRYTDNSLVLDNEILPGDILFTGVRCDAPDSMAFITLKKLKSGTVLFITDKGWLKEGSFRSGEDITRWETDLDVEAGTEIIISGLNSNIGHCTGSALSLSASGDQLFMYADELPDKANSGNFICGIQLNSSSGSSENYWDGEATSTSTSAKPSAIISGFNGIKFSPERDNLVYSGPKSGSLKEIRSNILNASNWSASDTDEIIITGNQCVIQFPELLKIKGMESGSKFSAGKTEIIFSVIDNSGNASECSFNVEVKDTTKPVFQKVEDIYANTNPNNCYATVSYNLPKAEDKCGELNYEIIESSVAGNEFPLGQSTIKLKATDNSGNSTTETFNIIVEDKTPPQLILPADIVTSNESGKGNVKITYDIPIAIDNCSDCKVEFVSGLGSGAFFPPGQTTEVYKAIDSEGNVTEDSFRIIVEENNQPEIIRIKNIDILEDDSITIFIQVYDQDINNELFFSASIESEFISLESICKDMNNYELKIIPEKNYFGNTRLLLKVCDNTNFPNDKDSCIIPINIIPVNDAPIIEIPDTIKVNEGTEVLIFQTDFLINDVDSPKENLNLILSQQPLYGSLIIDKKAMDLSDTIKYSIFTKAEIKYVHNGSEYFLDSLLLKVIDEKGSASIAKMSIKITSINDIPVLRKIEKFIINEDSTLYLDYNYFQKFISDTDTKFDNLELFFENNNFITIINDKKFRKFELIPKQNWFGSTNCKFVVVDKDDKISQYVDFQINPVNDKPEVIYFPKEIVFDNTSFAEINIYSLVYDVENEVDKLSYEFEISNDSVKFLFDNNTGNLKLYCFPNFQGDENLKFIVTDNENLSTESNSTIIVNNITSIKTNSDIPTEYKLFTAYPNPFNLTTKITYAISENEYVAIDVFNALGERVSRLVDETHTPGTYAVDFNASALPSGVYIYIIKAGRFVESKKMILVK